MQNIGPSSNIQRYRFLQQLQQNLQNKTFPPQAISPAAAASYTSNYPAQYQNLPLASLIPSQMALMGLQNTGIVQTPPDSYLPGGVAAVSPFNDTQPMIYTYIPQQLYKIPFQIPVTSLFQPQPYPQVQEMPYSAEGALPLNQEQPVTLTQSQLESLIQATSKKALRSEHPASAEPEDAQQTEVTGDETSEETRKSKHAASKKKPATTELTDDTDDLTDTSSISGGDQEAKVLGNKVGKAFTRLMIDNPDWKHAVEQMNIDDIIDNPDILRDKLRENRVTRFAIKHLPEQTVTIWPDQIQPVAQKTVDWLRDGITDKPMKEFHLLKPCRPRLPWSKKHYDDYNDF